MKRSGGQGVLLRLEDYAKKAFPGQGEVWYREETGMFINAEGKPVGSLPAGMAVGHVLLYCPVPGANPAGSRWFSYQYRQVVGNEEDVREIQRMSLEADDLLTQVGNKISQ